MAEGLELHCEVLSITEQALMVEHIEEWVQQGRAVRTKPVPAPQALPRVAVGHWSRVLSHGGQSAAGGATGHALLACTWAGQEGAERHGAYACDVAYHECSSGSSAAPQPLPCLAPLRTCPQAALQKACACTNSATAHSLWRCFCCEGAGSAESAGRHDRALPPQAELFTQFSTPLIHSRLARTGYAGAPSRRPSAGPRARGA